MHELGEVYALQVSLEPRMAAQLAVLRMPSDQLDELRPRLRTLCQGVVERGLQLVAKLGHAGDRRRRRREDERTTLSAVGTGSRSRSRGPRNRASGLVRSPRACGQAPADHIVFVSSSKAVMRSHMLLGPVSLAAACAAGPGGLSTVDADDTGVRAVFEDWTRNLEAGRYDLLSALSARPCRESATAPAARVSPRAARRS